MYLILLRVYEKFFLWMLIAPRTPLGGLGKPDVCLILLRVYEKVSFITIINNDKMICYIYKSIYSISGIDIHNYIQKYMNYV